MNRYNRFVLLIGTVLFASMLCSCGYWEETQEQESSVPYTGVMAMEEIPVVDYVVPQMSVNILADMEGYSAEGKKEVAVKGRELPEEFRLVDASTGETVYQGALAEAAYLEAEELAIGYADFSDFSEEGKYYLECDIIGQSYRFEIDEQHIEKLFLECYERMTSACRAGTLPVEDAILVLEAYEWYSEIFPDLNHDKTPDILADFRTWVTYMEAEPDMEETALYAAFLAKFSYNYQKYDRQYATDCLKRASTVFGQIKEAAGKEADRFFALTELYRATGLSTYGNRIIEYKSLMDSDSAYLAETGYLYGGMTYIVTRQNADMDICEIFMTDMKAQAEEISNLYQDMIHPVNARNNGTEDLLKRAIEVSCANYVTNNYQYTGIVEEFLHYLMGENMDSVNFYEQDSEKAEYLLLLAQLKGGSPQQ